MNQITIYIFIFGVSIGLFILAVAVMQLRSEKAKAAKQDTTEATVSLPPGNETVTPASTALAASAPEPGRPSSPPPVAIPEPIRAPSPTAVFSPRSGPVEVARLIHAPDGTLILEANGNWYTNRQDIADPKVLAVLAELERFLNSNGLLTAAPAFQPASIPDPKAAPKPTAMVDGKPAIVMTAAEAAQLPLAKPSMDIFRQIRTLRERENQPQIKIKSVLEEIDEILQTKLEGMPLAYRGLKVSSDATGAALFVVDGQAYTSVDQIPDAEARATFQAAIKEWERK